MRGALALAPALLPAETGANDAGPSGRRFAGASGLARRDSPRPAWLSRHVPPTPGELIADGRYLATRQRDYPPLGTTEVLYRARA